MREAIQKLSPYTKGTGLNWLFLCKTVLIFLSFLYPLLLIPIVRGSIPWLWTLLLLLLTTLFSFLTNDCSVRVFTKMHLFIRIKMTKKIMRQNVPDMFPFRERVEGDVAQTRSLLEDGIYGFYASTGAGILAVLLCALCCWPVGVIACMAALLRSLPHKNVKPDETLESEYRTFLTNALADKNNQKEKLALFVQWEHRRPGTRHTMFQLDAIWYLRMIAWLLAGYLLATGTALASPLLALVYFEYGCHFAKKRKEAQMEYRWRYGCVDRILAFWDETWPTPKSLNQCTTIFHLTVEENLNLAGISCNFLPNLNGLDVKADAATLSQEEKETLLHIREQYRK